MTKFIAVLISESNRQTIHALCPVLTEEKLNDHLETQRLLGETYYAIPNFIGKNGDTYDWVFLRSDALHEEFDFTLPKFRSQMFWITRK